MDVLLVSRPRKADEPKTIAGRLGRGNAAVLIDRDTYWQAPMSSQGRRDEVKARGIEAISDGDGTTWRRCLRTGIADAKELGTT